MTLVDTATAAAAAGVKPAVIRLWVHRKKLAPTLTIAGQHRFRLDHVLAASHDRRTVDNTQ